MCAACRPPGVPSTVPPLDLTPDEVDGFLDALQTFHEAFRSCVARSEPRHHFFPYMAEPCSALERKSLAPMAIPITGGNMRGLQRLISADVWNEPQLRRIYHSMVPHEMGNPQGVLRCDESGFVKQGRESVGGARQSCGSVGKVENCQGVSLPPRSRPRGMPWGISDAFSPRHGVTTTMPSSRRHAERPGT